MWLTTRTRPDVAYTVGVMSRLLHKRPGYVVEVGQQCLKYLCGSASKKLQYKGGGPIDVLEVMVDASFGPPHEGYRSVQGIMMTHGGNPIMWASTRQPFITQSTAEAELLAYNEAYQNGESTGALLEVLGYGGVKKHMQGDSKSGISQLTSDTGAWRTRHLRLRSAKLREVVQDPEEPWTVSHCSGLELGADGLTKPLQGQAFTRFLGLIGMAEDEEVSVSKVMGPSWTSSTTASTGFNTALEGVGAAVMGVGALMDSEPLVLGGLAMVAVSLYRQRHGVQCEQEGFDLHHGGDLLPGVENLAEASEPQLNEKRKKEEKSLMTKRLAKRPQKDHKSGQPPKGNLDEAAHPPHPQSRASTAEDSKENLGCNGSQSFFPGYGGVAYVPGCLSTDRARPCASNGVESSRPPKGALQEQSVHVTGRLQSVSEVPRVSALRYEGDPDDPIEDDDSEADPGVPFPHGDPHGNAYLRHLGQVPPNYKAPPVQWMQQHAPKAALPKARPKRRAEEAQPKQRAEAFQRAVAAERGSIHQAVQREQQQGASSSSSTGQQGYPQRQPPGAPPREPTDNEVDEALRRVAENWLFTQPPRVQDGWHYMDVVELFGKRYRVVMRNHRTSRRRSFHPVHRGAPGNLLGRRLTVIHGNGRRSEVADNWSESWETTGWTGYTLFLQRLPEGLQQPATSSQSSTQPVATTQLDEEAEGDGSFELVEDDDPGGQGQGPQLRAMSLFSSADGAMGSSVTSASTRLVADEGEMGLDLMDIPKGLIKKRTKRVKQDRLEDSSWSGKGKGSGVAPVIQKMSPNRKGYPKGSTMSLETQNMSTTTKGTSLGHVAGDLQSFDGERAAVLTLLRPGSNIDGQPPPALRFFAVMSDGGEDQGDRGRQEDRDDRLDRDVPGQLYERCPGKPKPKRVSLKPVPSLVTLRPALQVSRVPDDEVHCVEESSQDEEKEGIRSVVLDDEKGFSSGDDAVPVQEGQASSSGLGAGKSEQGEDQLHGEALRPGDAEKGEVLKQEGPKPKKYRRVRVKKQVTQLEKDIQEMQSARRVRNERMARLRLLQQQRQRRQEAAEPLGQQELPASEEPQEDKKPEEVKAEEPKEPQPRTPSPSSVDWKAAEEETERQFAEAKAAGRRILSYEEWDKERKEKNENLRQATLRRSWLDREIARRALQQERGETREAVLRSTTASASGPLTDEEWVQMQQMMKRLPSAPPWQCEMPKKDEEQPQDKRAKTVQQDPKHGMPPPQPDLPAPPPQGYAGVWRGGCCPGFRWQGVQQGHHGPQAPHGQQGFAPGCGGQQHQGPPRGPQGFHPGLQGQAPAQQSVSLDLGPVRYRSPEELAEATAWLERQRGGPEVDLRTPGDVVRHDLAMAMAKSRAKAGMPTPPPTRMVSPPRREVPAPPPEQQQGQGGGEDAGESLLQRILRLASAGPICARTPPSTSRVPSPSRTLSSTSEAEILEVQYDETSAEQNEQMALRPKARPLQRDPRHGAMAATGGDGGRDGPGDGDDPRRNDRASPEPEAEDDEGDSVEGTATQEFMYRMKRRSDELTGKKNKFQVGKNSAWVPQKLRKGRGHTVRWWPERRGKGTRGEDSTITHSVTSPTTGWQRIYAKGKQPSRLQPRGQRQWGPHRPARQGRKPSGRTATGAVAAPGHRRSPASGKRCGHPWEWQRGGRSSL